MYRQSSSRNQRSKRIKVKHALQICLLLAVSLWLIYQVKHSHDKKKEFDESDAKDVENSGGFIRIGRKDIPETITKNDEHYEEEIEEIKHEEEEFQEDKKLDDEDEDETDEHELDKLDAEVDREEDFLDDEKELADGKNSDDVGNDRITDEAREEHYKADDASSAVTHDKHVETTKNENKSVGNIIKHVMGNENRTNKSEETDIGEIKRVGNPSNVTYGEISENHSTLDVGNNPQQVNSTGYADPPNNIDSSALVKNATSEAALKDEVLKSEITKSPNSVEEKNVHVNLDIVPEIQRNEGNNPKDVVAQ